jgi:hypothetical protein
VHLHKCSGLEALSIELPESHHSSLESVENSLERVKLLLFSAWANYYVMTSFGFKTKLNGDVIISFVHVYIDICDGVQ